MAFRDLKQQFDAAFELNRGQDVIGKSGLDVFRALYLKTLFEINGNLDTIALSSRAVVELFDAKGGQILGELQAIRGLLEKMTAERAEPAPAARTKKK